MRVGQAATPCAAFCAPAGAAPSFGRFRWAYLSVASRSFLNHFDPARVPAGADGIGASSGDTIAGAAMAASASGASQLYATQLQDLAEMGFADAERNLRALVATGGNVPAAIEWMLSERAGG